MSENNNKLVTKGVESYQQEFSEGERASIDIITAAVRDRDGEMVLPQGIDLTDYRKNPVVIWGHKHSDGLPIGKNIWIKYDKVKNALIAKTQYADHTFANEVYEYRKNFPLGISIGFIPKEWIDKDEFDDVTLKSIGLTKKDVAGVNRIFTKCSLLEYSLVNIPSVADATMLAINKGLMSKEEAIENNFPIKEINLESIQSGELTKELDLENIEIKDETVTKPETTENYHRIPVIPKDKFVQDSFRTIDITSGIKAIIGKLKSDPSGSTKVHTYLFDVNKFSMAESEAWAEAHKKEVLEENVKEKELEQIVTEEKAKKPCKKEMCDGEGCQEFDSCSEPMKKVKDASEDSMDDNEDPMPCEDGSECPGMNCPQHKACAKPEKKELDLEDKKAINLGDAYISLRVNDAELDIVKMLFEEVKLLKEEINNLKEQKDVLPEKDIVKELKDHIDSKFEAKEVQNVEEKEIQENEDIVFEIEQKEVKSALDESLEIDITKEQLGELIKDAILNVTKESKKSNEIDLSQITMDALKKAKGEIF